MEDDTESRLSSRQGNMDESKSWISDQITNTIITIGHTDCCCSCFKEPPALKLLDKESKVDEKMLTKLLTDKELELRAEFKETLDNETNYLKERFNYILENEQVRSALKLREAHRERKEKIRILTQQLECKNIAGLMYVMCAERARSKFEKLQIIEKYTNYINYLNEILEEGQELILNLSRGYKTAARVDYEWQQKMKKVIKAFQTFIYHYGGGTPEQNQYLFDFPTLLHTAALIEDDPCEDPIENYEEESEDIHWRDLPENKEWWERLDDDDRPFVVVGDLGDVPPVVRRNTVKKLRVKAPKTAPLKWKEYVFRDMFIRANCPTADELKDDFFERIPDPEYLSCDLLPGHVISSDVPPSTADQSRRPSETRRYTAISMGNAMGSILKVIASGYVGNINQAQNKTNLLGAKDSMELTSSTKVRDMRRKKPKDQGQKETPALHVGEGRRISLFDPSQPLSELIDMGATSVVDVDRGILSNQMNPREEEDVEDEDNEVKREEEETEPDGECRRSSLQRHRDSLTVISNHVPEKDHSIRYEKMCPLERCQRSDVETFKNSLPVYMREPTYTHREQRFENYETCSREQLEILKKRLEEAKKREKLRRSPSEVDPLVEWKPSVGGVACQTSNLSYLENEQLPCNCKESSILSDAGVVYRREDLIPVKQKLDRIEQSCFFDDKIQFHRFKVIGESKETLNHPVNINDPTTTKLLEIRKILKQHPSLLDIFQANIRC